jgi:hypothetical protein
MMSLAKIAELLETLGVAHHALESGEEGAVLALPECGRVLGLWPQRRGENALWINPEFLHRLQIGAKDDRWVSPGGDCMWIAVHDDAPAGERGEQGESQDLSAVPAALDPGRFTGGEDRGAYRMENKGELFVEELRARITFRLIRRFHPLDEDGLIKKWDSARLRQAGYDEETTLEVSGDCPAMASLRNVTWVRGEGDALIPLRKYWGDTSLADLPTGSVGLASGCAVFGLRGEKPLRIFLSADEIGSRVLIFQERAAGRALLLVKDFEKTAGRRGIPADFGRRGISADFRRRGIPADTFASRGASILECFHGPNGSPGEISCFSPVVGGSSGRRRIQWRSSLCAFWGRVDEVKAFLQRALR